MQALDILFADEPVASLDPQAGEGVMQLLSDLAKEKNMTLMFVTHNLEHAIRYADRVIGLQSGAIGLDAPTADQNIQELRSMYG